MTIIKEVTIEGKRHQVTVSDDNEALLAAAAAGGAIVGIWDPDRTPTGAGFDACLYLTDSLDTIDERLLERAVRRRLGLPWIIGETNRLRIREFTNEDPLEPASPDDGDGVFSDYWKRKNYIENQYRFQECGLWALVEKQTGRVIGKAGLTDGELGYHIYFPFRRQGYALEACRGILDYARESQEFPSLFLKVKAENEASIQLAKKLGFTRKEGQQKTEECVYWIQFDREA